jgi:hypothetical protein
MWPQGIKLIRLSIVSSVVLLIFVLSACQPVSGTTTGTPEPTQDTLGRIRLIAELLTPIIIGGLGVCH